ncbi:hypothetical protein GCM10010425_65680 [Streptomyces spororaveus]
MCASRHSVGAGTGLGGLWLICDERKPRTLAGLLCPRTSWSPEVLGSGYAADGSVSGSCGSRWAS